MGDTQFPYFVIQGPGTDAELFRSVFLDPKGIFQGLEDKLFFVFGKGLNV